MANKIKVLLRNNDLSLRLIYLFKYKIGRNISYHRELSRVNRGEPRSKEMSEKLEKLKNIRKGKKCVIVGNGPSMRFSDLDRLHELRIDTFGSNRIVDVLNKTSWRPTYLCVMDPAFLIGVSSTVSVGEYLYSIKDEDFLIILNDCLRTYIPEDMLTWKKLYLVSCNLAELYSTRQLPFSENIPLYVSDLGSVTQFCIQVACYMGYEEIYLYGMDNSFVKYYDDDGAFKVNRHQSMHPKGMKTNIDDTVSDVIPKSKFEAYKLGGFADLRKNNYGYRVCNEYANKHGIHIYNVTRGGALEIFERKLFDEVFIV